MIATLAQKFDGDHPGVEYAANVMLFKPSKGMSLEEAATIRSQLLFCDETVSVEQLKGTLQLDVELSTTAADPTASPDPAMQPIALPIPKTPKNGLRYKVFPGAPLAFIEREPDLYTDTAALPKWAEEYGDFTREVINSMAKYFAQSTVRSFISLPLFGIRDDGSDEETVDPLAVLNVHSSQAGLLKERGEPLTHFVSIIRPFRVFLVQLLSALHPDAPSMKPDIKIDKSTSDMKDEAS